MQRSPTRPLPLTLKHLCVTSVYSLGLLAGTGCTPKAPGGSTPAAAESSVQPAPVAPWVVHGNGVGEVVTGRPIPQSAYDREGKSLAALWDRPARGLDDFALMEAGLLNMEGYRVVPFSVLDLRVQLNRYDRVLGIWPGPSVRTEQGTGLGSTVAELESAHGEVTLHSIPEPYRCSGQVEGLAHVSFLFDDCEQARSGAASVAVYIGGYDDPEDE